MGRILYDVRESGFNADTALAISPRAFEGNSFVSIIFDGFLRLQNTSTASRGKVEKASFAWSTRTKLLDFGATEKESQIWTTESYPGLSGTSAFLILVLIVQLQILLRKRANDETARQAIRVQIQHWSNQASGDWQLI